VKFMVFITTDYLVKIVEKLLFFFFYKKNNLGNYLVALICIFVNSSGVVIAGIALHARKKKNEQSESN
jgi:hypothetical protein